jgi:hypothetical protein
MTFFALTFLFAGFIVWAGRLESECVRIGGEPFELSKAAFADAFALSWTTFSTVVCLLSIVLPCGTLLQCIYTIHLAKALSFSFSTTILGLRQHISGSWT